MLLTFIKTKLGGKVQEGSKIDELLKQLKMKIKPDNSKGKMMALMMQRQNPQTFAREAEQSVDAFQRLLTIEGISLAKANKMTIDKTIEMCRASGKSNVVRSIRSTICRLEGVCSVTIGRNSY